MKLQPYVQVDATPFTASRAQVVRLKGKPRRESRNGVGLDELDYGTEVLRFQDSGRLEEITVQAPVVYFGRLDIPFAALESFVRREDPSWFERAGFIVSPKFGLAFDPDGPCWVTALARHCIESWRAI